MNSILHKILPAKYPAPPIALLTDFGNADHYVGTMKGVIASINPTARVIDISHSVSAQNTTEAAYVLWASYRFFPKSTVFVIVVDPGVGSTRDILLCHIASRWFLFPDNGVADLVLGEQPADETFRVAQDDSSYLLSAISATFHGRDIFAPIAAYMSRGVLPREFGNACPPPRGRMSFCEKPDKSASVLHIDHFGNIVTDIRGRPDSIRVGGRQVRRWIRTYSDAPSRLPCMLEGSSGLVEIVVKNGSAARNFRVASGARLRVMWR